MYIHQYRLYDIRLILYIMCICIVGMRCMILLEQSVRYILIHLLINAAISTEYVVCVFYIMSVYINVCGTS